MRLMIGKHMKTNAAKVLGLCLSICILIPAMAVVARAIVTTHEETADTVFINGEEFGVDTSMIDPAIAEGQTALASVLVLDGVNDGEVALGTEYVSSEAYSVLELAVAEAEDLKMNATSHEEVMIGIEKLLSAIAGFNAQVRIGVGEVAAAVAG